MGWNRDAGIAIFRIRRDVEDWKRARTATRRNRNRRQLRDWVRDAKRLYDRAPSNAPVGQLNGLWVHWYVANKLVGPTPHWRIDRAYRTLVTPQAYRALIEARDARHARPRPSRATGPTGLTRVESRLDPSAKAPGLIATIVGKVKDKMAGKRTLGSGLPRGPVLALGKPTRQDEAAFNRMVELTAEVRRTGNQATARILFGVAQGLLHIMESGKYRRMGAGLQNAIRRAIDEAIRTANVALNPVSSFRFDGKRAKQQTFEPMRAVYLQQPTIAQFQAQARAIAVATGKVRATGDKGLAADLQRMIAQLESDARKTHIKQALLALPAEVQRAVLAGLRTAKKIAAWALAAGEAGEQGFAYPAGGGGGGGDGYYSDDDSYLNLDDDYDDDDDEDGDYADTDADFATSSGGGADAYWSDDDNEIEADDLEFLDEGDQFDDEIDGEEQITDDDAAELVSTALTLPAAPVGLVEQYKASVRAHPLMWGAAGLGAAALAYRYWQRRQEA
jgi:hypothetical protein